MKYLKYAVLAALILALLAACGQVTTPQVDNNNNIGVLDDALVTDGVSAMSSVSFGNICTDTSATRQIRLYAVASGRESGYYNPFAGQYSGSHIWANNAFLNAFAYGDSTATANGFVSTTGGSFPLEWNWQSFPNGWRSAHYANTTITFTAGSATGLKVGSIAYQLSGQGSTGGTLSRLNTVIVSANVVSCNEAPVISIQQPLSFEGNTPGGWDFSSFNLVGTATDSEDGGLEDGQLSVSCTPAVGSVLPVGSNTVSCTAIDSDGLTATASGTITVTDTMPPLISGMPDNQALEATGAGGAVANWTMPTANDVVDGPVAVECAPGSGSTFALGTTTVTCTATDSENNTASQSFDVTVIDPTAPFITPTITGNLGQNGWYTSNVMVTWTVVDEESGITSTDGCEEATITTDSAGTTLACSAVSAGGMSSESVTIKRDATAPEVRVLGVEDGATYTVGTVPMTSCETSDITSGVKTPASLTMSGGDGDGSGSFTATCGGAEDHAGNQSSVTHHYTVVAPIAIDVQVNATGTVNRTTGVATLSGTVSCSAPTAVPLRIELSQEQKQRGITITVVGSEDITVNCSGQKAWAAAITATNGIFVNGEAQAAASVDSDSLNRVTRTVRLQWLR
jgi:hypothetical protein